MGNSIRPTIVAGLATLEKTPQQYRASAMNA
jgi:hypothetical protein